MAIRTVNEGTNVVTIGLEYNPFTYETNLNYDTNNYKLNSTIEFLNKNREKMLQHWYKDFFNCLKEDLNSICLDFTFKGRNVDAEDIIEQITELNEKNNWKISYNFSEHISNENIFDNLEKLVSDIKTNAPDVLLKKLQIKNAFEEFEAAKTSEAYVSVIATMSSGKSTLINAILEQEILPSKNEACTATICRIKDVDEKEEYTMRVEDLEGNEIHPLQNADLDKLTDINNQGNEKGLNIFLEGDIPGISSQEMNLVVIDTPGPNNSQNEKHKRATYEYIKDNKNNPLVLYIMNATQHGTNDDNMLISEIADIIKQKGKQAEERFLFALNKIDCFDVEKESIEKLINNSLTYLKSKGIENPKIFPISAEFAKLKKLNMKGHKLSRKGQQDLNNFIFTFIPDDGYQGIDTIKYASLNQNVKTKFYEESLVNEDKAHLHYSGISAIETYIDNYVSKYAKTQKIKDSIKTLKEVLDSSYSEIQLTKSRTESELINLQEQIEKIKVILETSGPEKIKNAKGKIDSITPNTSKIDNLVVQIGVINSKLSEEFSHNNVSKNKAFAILDEATEALQNLSISLQTSVESIIEDEVYERANEIISIINDYFKNITEGLEFDVDLKQTLNNMFVLEIPRARYLVESNTRMEEVYKGQEFSHYESASKWWNPFSWGSKKEVFRDVYEREEYVDLQALFDNTIEPLLENFRKPIKDTSILLQEKIVDVKNNANKTIEKVEGLFKENILKLQENIENSKNKENATQEMINEISKIENFKIELDTILKI